jgi:predicted methyltransferase
MKYCITLLSLLILISHPSRADREQLAAAAKGEHRTAAYVERDRYRNPIKTLQLFDVQPEHTVVEIWPGGGWYTEILAPYLRDEGKLIAAHYDSTDTQASYRANSRKQFEKKLAANNGVYGRVAIVSLMFDEQAGKVSIPAAGSNSVDRIVTFRNAHGWYARGITEAAFAHFYDILKPGGKLGLVQHRADPDQDWMSRNIGYVGREYMIGQALKAGFVLEVEGYFNQNPLDTKRYEIGVWQLPPTLRDLESDAQRAPYHAIGESDRMTLVFLKPY